MVTPSRARGTRQRWFRLVQASLCLLLKLLHLLVLSLLFVFLATLVAHGSNAIGEPAQALSKTAHAR
jgi:hypothetical protein